jgi:hypothetical protein
VAVGGAKVSLLAAGAPLLVSLHSTPDTGQHTKSPDRWSWPDHCQLSAGMSYSSRCTRSAWDSAWRRPIRLPKPHQQSANVAHSSNWDAGVYGEPNAAVLPYNHANDPRCQTFVASPGPAHLSKVVARFIHCPDVVLPPLSENRSTHNCQRKGGATVAIASKSFRYERSRNGVVIAGRVRGKRYRGRAHPALGDRAYMSRHTQEQAEYI